MTKINSLQIEAELAEKYKYKPLPPMISQEYRALYERNIPDFLKINGDGIDLRTMVGAVVCKGYERIVIGDYGAFVEFSETQANKVVYFVPPKQRFRIDSHLADRVKYEWWSINDGSDVKIYKQKREVNYADYKVGMYYVSVHEIFLNFSS